MQTLFEFIQKIKNLALIRGYLFYVQQTEKNQSAFEKVTVNMQ